MDPRLVMAIIAAVALVVIVALPLAWYNKLVRLRQLIRESWGNVDVQIRRRYDLIPNLVATVKGYATHERFGDFPPQDYFEVDDHTVRAAPVVAMTT